MSNRITNSSVFALKTRVADKKLHFLGAMVIFIVFGAAGCRYDMQDQPRQKAYKPSTFFADGKGMRDYPPGTVSRGHLDADKALYTGKKENADLNAPVQSTTDASGNLVVTSFPNDIDVIPVPVTPQLLDRGQSRYNIYCGVCHGPVGKGDGMVVRRGFPKPPTYHDDRLRNAPVGHFFDVITNGWGRMSSYSTQLPVDDRWAVVAYIRALQLSQDPNGTRTAPAGATKTNNTNSNTNGGNAQPNPDQGGQK